MERLSWESWDFTSGPVRFVQFRKQWGHDYFRICLFWCQVLADALSFPGLPGYIPYNQNIAVVTLTMFLQSDWNHSDTRYHDMRKVLPLLTSHYALAHEAEAPIKIDYDRFYFIFFRFYHLFIDFWKRLMKYNRTNLQITNARKRKY